jgi:serine peptidase DegS
MSPAWKAATFVAQSVAVGLALAFVAVLVKPELLGGRPTTPAVGAAPVSYASAVAASAPAVATIYAGRTLRSPSNTVGLTLLGSGVVIDTAGHVVTNWHVIQDADEIRVQLADGRVATPTLVGTDPETELALLRIDLSDLPEIALGRSDTLQVGDVVLAIGTSLGLSQTVTMGIVSATGRGQLGVTTFEDFIQTDAAINVGNSGGALVNTRGELVGINTAVISRDRSMPEGLGFAIPVNLVRGVMQQIQSYGRVIRGYLGVDDSVDLAPAQTQALGLADGGAVLITLATGPAAAAGLRAGDVITHLNGERVRNRREAMNLVAKAQPGDRLKIRFVRANGTQFDTEAVLEERPPPNGAQ